MLISIFTTEMVVSDFGQIVDLGPVPMSSIRTSSKSSSPPDRREKDPELFYLYSTARQALKDGKKTPRGARTRSRAKIVEGHSYVLRKLSRDRYVVAGFHVKKYEPGQKVVLDQIEVFSKGRLESIPYRLKH